MRSSSKSGKETESLEKAITKQKTELTRLRKLLKQTTYNLAITTHKLKKSDGKFNVLMANSYEAMALFDKDFNILYRSPGAYKISGWTEEDLSNNPPITNVHPEDNPIVQKALVKVLRTKNEPVYVTFRSKHKNGNLIWVEGIFRNMLDDDAVEAIVLNLRDITSRKSAEQNAAASEANLNTIFENISDGIVLVSSDGVIQLFNSNAVRFTLQGTGKALVVGENIDDYIDDSRKEMFKGIFANVLSGETYEYDRYLTVEGNTRWVNVSMNSTIYNGELKGICMVTRDITARKEAELKIIEREEQFRTLIERISDAFISFDKDLRYTYMNKKAGEITQRDPQSLIGKHVWDVFPEAIGSSTYETFNKAMSEQVYLCNTDYFEPLNLWQENHLYPSKNGLSVFIRDISERKRAEKKLVDSELRFRSLIENINDAIILTDENLNVTYQSPAVERITGISLAYRQANPRVKFTHPDDLSIIDQAVQKSKHNPGTPVLFQSRFLHINGNYIWIEGFMTNHLNNPNMKAMVFTYRDISERKNSEAEILNLNERLEEKVAQRTEQLEALNKELESFTYSVSHDLRAPLRIINGFSQIILEDNAEHLDEAGRKNLSVIVNNAKRMGMLIDDLLNFSRIGKAQIRIASVNMQVIVSEVLEEIVMSKTSIPESLHVEDLLPIKGDIALLKQVWINLISNAIKYSGKKDNPKISIGSYQDKDRIVYFVKDNGAGFDMLYVNKLFGVFQRLHKLEEFTGTGVGLALVQRIVLRHEGAVWAEGKLNEGATFYFALPVR